MFSSLRVRLFASYILLIFLSLAMAALAFVFLLRSYQSRLTTARLGDITVPLISQIREQAQQGKTPAEMLTYLSDQADELGVRILLIGVDGRVVRDTSTSESLAGQQLNVPLSRLPTEPRQTFRGRYTTPDGQTFFYAAIPIRALLGLGRAQTGIAAIVIAQPQGGLDKILADLFPTISLSAGVAIIAALIVGYVLTRSIVWPISTLTKASEGIAKGLYGQRVPVSGPSELQRLAETFNVMAHEVERSRQLMRDFLANVAHEFKTPLTSIRGFVQAQLDGTVKDDAGRQKSLQIVDGEAARLQRLVNELLELSRLEARQVSMAKEPVRLSELASQCAEIFALRAEEAQVKLTVDVPPELSVLGDFDRLEQVFANLIDNALKHVRPDGQIALSAGRGSDGYIRMSVTDDGPGIAADDLSHLFERFYTGDMSGPRRGSGLGLAIAREIARSHGGDITVESVEGMGTKFVVQLPGR